ncbi:M20/M25/M40 family metallo-hydrolase [Nakamurella sp. YIM 132087]|uniref:M20/M25/M40 family metallo-hydrolase n=2 Tax=Nakamurella alba TaxID=2665158 RepID=A0A7K1FTL4_9ACTN|nr:M20/M25/M40 family metallo-hydrolase [Nakamurella alba]
MVDDIGTLVRCESPSSDHEALHRSAAVVVDLAARITGAEAETVVLAGVPHVRVRTGTGDGPRVLLLAHHDTVWPIGTLATLPFDVTDGVLRGPGCFDMKAGVVMALHALRGCEVPVTLLVTGDEEVGSGTSRALIEQEAAGCAAVLVTEPSGDGGAIKIARKGVANYLFTVEGRAAHAGLEPEKGVNAGLEIARIALAAADLGNSEVGTTVTPTTSAAGESSNTVPARAWLRVDVRFAEPTEFTRVDQALRALAPADPAARILVDADPPRPPLTTEMSSGLAALACELAPAAGVPVPELISVGGGSDGNFTAALGIPTLDGLGAVGGGAHAVTEHLLVSELAGRTRLLRALIERVAADAAAD